MSSNYIVVHPYNKKGGKSVTAKTILCNLKKKKVDFYFQSRWYYVDICPVKRTRKKKSHKIYRMVFKTAGHQKMMDKGSQQSENKWGWVHDHPSLLSWDKVQAMTQLRWGSQAKFQKLPELRKSQSPETQATRIFMAEYQRRKNCRENSRSAENPKYSIHVHNYNKEEDIFLILTFLKDNWLFKQKECSGI